MALSSHILTQRRIPEGRGDLWAFGPTVADSPDWVYDPNRMQTQL